MEMENFSGGHCPRGRLHFTCHVSMWMATWGLRGFAEADDLRQLVASVQSDRAQVLEEAMLAINEKYCTSQPGSETRKLYLRLILERQKNYFELKNRRFDLPGCGDI